MQQASHIQDKLVGLDAELRELISSNTLEKNYYTFREKMREAKNELRSSEAQKMTLYLFEFLGGCHKVMSVDFVRKQAAVLQKWDSVYNNKNIAVMNKNSVGIKTSIATDVNGNVPQTDGAKEKMLRQEPEISSGVSRQEATTLNAGTMERPPATPSKPSSQPAQSVKEGLPTNVSKQLPVQKPAASDRTNDKDIEMVPTVEALEEELTGSDIYQPSQESVQKSRKRHNLRNYRRADKEDEAMHMDIDEIVPDAADFDDESDDIKVVRKRRRKVADTDAEMQPSKKRRPAKRTGKFNEKPCQNCAQRDVQCEIQQAGGTCMGCYRLKKKCEYAGPRGGGGVVGIGRKKKAHPKKSQEVIVVTDDDEPRQKVNKSTAAGTTAAGITAAGTSGAGTSGAGTLRTGTTVNNDMGNATDSDDGKKEYEEWRLQRRAEKQPVRAPRKSSAVKQLGAALEKLDELALQYEFLVDGTQDFPGLNSFPDVIRMMWERMDTMDNQMKRLISVQNRIVKFVKSIQTLQVGNNDEISINLVHEAMAGIPANDEFSMEPPADTHLHQHSAPPPGDLNMDTTNAEPIDEAVENNVGIFERSDVEMSDERASGNVITSTVNLPIDAAPAVQDESGGSLVVAIPDVAIQLLPDVADHQPPDGAIQQFPANAVQPIPAVSASSHTEISATTTLLENSIIPIADIPVPSNSNHAVSVAISTSLSDVYSQHITNSNTSETNAKIISQSLTQENEVNAVTESTLHAVTTVPITADEHVDALISYSGHSDNARPVILDDIPVHQPPAVVLTPPTPATSQEFSTEMHTLAPPTTDSSVRRSPRFRARSITPMP